MFDCEEIIMKKESKWPILVLLLVLLFIAAVPASALFPKSDTLFGVTMPDIAFAVSREADQVETVPEGERVIYTSFQPADYEAFGKYAKAAGLSLKNQSYQDGILTTELSKDEASITFTYNYDEKAASLFYPSNVRKEDQKNSAQLSGNLLPDINKTFGAVIPSLKSILRNHPEAKMVKASYRDEILYSEVTVSDFDAINAYLTEIGCSLINLQTKEKTLTADLKLNGKFFACRYDLDEQTFSFICPELYYVEPSFSKTVKTDHVILPGAEEAFGSLLPRISSAIFRYPDRKETLADGSYCETYLNFTEKDYNTFSTFLLGTDCSVGNFFVDNTGALVISLSLQGQTFTFSYDQLGNRGIAIYPKGAPIKPEIPRSAFPTPVPTATPTSVPTATPKKSTISSKGNSSSDSWSSFTNKYGTPTTRCAHPGCSNYIASSGDTNCCVSHSRRCLECGTYIDEDAVYCMDCIDKALRK